MSETTTQPRCEMHIGDLRADAPACGKPAAWRFASEQQGWIYACGDCIGAGRRYAEAVQIDPTHSENA